MLGTLGRFKDVTEDGGHVGVDAIGIEPIDRLCSSKNQGWILVKKTAVTIYWEWCCYSSEWFP
jgi:hypothetical protein